MYFHLNKEEFKSFIKIISNRTNLDEDIIEKDYYVCEILKQLSNNQNYLKAYFKGGTALYKMLDKMNRFSEDIDLTVKVIESESNTSNKNRLKKSALIYKIPDLELDNNKTKNNRQSITAFYKYKTDFLETNYPLHKSGEIQVESTSFTISEPTETHKIESIIYSAATNEERKILREKFEIEPFNLEVQKLERIFVDKLFAAQFYYSRNSYMDFSKHIYDIIILLEEKRIIDLLENDKYFEKLVDYKRKEESFRIGGVSQNLKINEFEYFNFELNNEIVNQYEIMQNKYIFKDEYKKNIREIKEKLIKLKSILEKLEG